MVANRNKPEHVPFPQDPADWYAVRLWKRAGQDSAGKLVKRNAAELARLERLRSYLVIPVWFEGSGADPSLWQVWETCWRNDRPQGGCERCLVCECMRTERGALIRLERAFVREDEAVEFAEGLNAEFGPSVQDLSAAAPSVIGGEQLRGVRMVRPGDPGYPSEDDVPY